MLLDCLGFFLQGKAPVLSNFGSFHPAPSCPWKWCLERHYAWWVKLSAAGELEFSTEDPSARADSPLHYNVPPPKTFRVSLNEFESLENKMNIQEIQSDLSPLSICKQEILGIISILHRTDPEAQQGWPIFLRCWSQSLVTVNTHSTLPVRLDCDPL